jgi:transaldolase
MIKVPVTPAGVPAIETLIADGINVNITLIFSLAHYEASAGAFIRGLERRAEAGQPLGSVASVASFFVSRLDSAVDKQLAEIGRDDLFGKTAVDNARVAYARFGELFAGERWEALAAKGAQVQRVLWASTGTKNPAYPDTMYVDELIGPATVNTVPPKTLDAFIDHGTVARTVDRDLDGARARLNALAALAIDVDDITADLQRAGVASFASAFESLLASIDAKRAAL